MKNNNQKRTFGVVGTVRGSGCTHFSIALANFLYMVYGKRTALIELNGSQNVFDKIRYERKCDDEKVFKIHGVDYYKNAGHEEFVDIYGSDYDYIVIDFGTYSEKVRKKLVFCTDKCLIANHTIWKEEENEQTIELINQQMPEAKFKCLTYFGDDYDRKIYKQIPKLTIPQVEKQHFPFLMEVVKE